MEGNIPETNKPDKYTGKLRSPAWFETFNRTTSKKDVRNLLNAPACHEIEHRLGTIAETHIHAEKVEKRQRIAYNLIMYPIVGALCIVVLNFSMIFNLLFKGQDKDY